MGKTQLCFMTDTQVCHYYKKTQGRTYMSDPANSSENMFYILILRANLPMLNP